MTTIDEIRDNFELLEDWDDRYRYVIELGRTLEPMPEEEHSAENKVNGFVSQVWLQKLVDRGNGAPILKYRGDSDAHIVRGLVAIVLSLYSGRTPQEILDTDAISVFNEFVYFIAGIGIIVHEYTYQVRIHLFGKMDGIFFGAFRILQPVYGGNYLFHNNIINDV